jgi:MFS family permease
MGIVAPLGEWLLYSSRNMLYLAIGPILSVLCCFFGGRVKIQATAASQEMHRDLGDSGKKWGSYSGLFSSRSFLFLILTGIIIALVDALIITLSLLTSEKGLMVSYFFASASITALLVRLPGASILNALPRIPLLAPCGILMSLSMILVSFFPSNSALIAGGLLFGIGLGAGWPMYQALISDLLEPLLRPKGTATALLLYDTGFFITPLIVGYFLPRYGTSGTFAAIALTAGIALVFLEILYWLPLYRKLRSGGERRP